MSLITCIDCGKQISDRATACPGCGAPVAPMLTTIHPSPPVPDNQTIDSGTSTGYRSYAEVPWYRQSNVNTAFILISMGTKGLLPLTLVTCILVLTGDIYYKAPDKAGNIRVWSKANKIAAVVILIANIVLLGYMTGRP